LGYNNKGRKINKNLINSKIWIKKTTKHLAWLAVAHARCTKNIIIPLKKNTRKRKPVRHVGMNTNKTVSAIVAVSNYE